MSKIDPIVEQAVDTLDLNRVTRRRLLGGIGLTSASLAASALLAACTNNDDKSGDAAAAGAGDFPSTPKWRFVFVNHVTTNPFFTPTQYGAAGRLLAAQLRVPVDRFQGLDRGRDGQRHQHRDLRQG